ncbi:methyl-accepting chemotaxis protein [Candidatus Halobeggiatoa sp. HSG11]|nr:methyl-accepting chemotaxis protein [Candidatus Halobeggiatoa sp. HSG11]
MLQNMKIRTKLFSSFGVLILFLILISLFAILQMQTLSKVTTELYDHPLTVSNAVRDVNINIVKIHRSMKDAALAKDTEALKAAIKMVNSYEQAVYANFDIIAERFLGDKQDVNNLRTLFVDWKSIRDEVIDLMRKKQGEQAAAITKGKGAKHVSALESAIDKLTDFANNKATQFLENANYQKNQLLTLVLFIMLIAIVIGVWITIVVSGTISNSVNKAIKFANLIADGNLNNQIEFETETETGRLLQVLDSMQTQLRERIDEINNTKNQLQERMEEDKRIANEALRINQALDKVITSVLITDSNHKIIYINEAAQHLFSQKEDQICADLPHFNATKLINVSIDIFYKNPTQQRQLLANLVDSHHDTLKLGKVTIDTTITPVINQAGERLGTVLEFKDRTVEIATEQEINNVIHAASQGNFQQRIDTNNKTDFFKTFSESINQIIEINQVLTKDVMRMFAALAKGDLTQKIENNYTGAFERLKDDSNLTVDRLTEIMQEILQQAEMVNNASTEISQGNISLSQRTEEQAASLEETSASMEQMTGTVQQNADNSKYAAQLAISARDQAEKGGNVIGSTISAMTEISKSSKKITEIISVIDEIAFQTNLLALNAAVEAARAGEQGRGFAVVASEVRNLAQRSAAAAKEIKNLIQDSVNKVDEGTQLANKSGETLSEIVIAVKKVNDIITEIASASQEQASGINQVNDAVVQMDEMTQQNATLVEELSTSSNVMKDQVQSLKSLVSFFKIKGKTYKQTSTPKPTITTLPNQNENQEDNGWEDF